MLDEKPVLFISHRHADRAIADTLRKFVQARTSGRISVYQSSSANADGPKHGKNLSQELRQALWRAGAVILIYTNHEQNWSYCMWECRVGAGIRVPSRLDHGDGEESSIELTVAPPIEPVPAGLAARRWNRAGAGMGGECGGRREPLDTRVSPRILAAMMCPTPQMASKCEGFRALTAEVMSASSSSASFVSWCSRVMAASASFARTGSADRPLNTSLFAVARLALLDNAPVSSR